MHRIIIVLQEMLAVHDARRQRNLWSRWEDQSQDRGQLAAGPISGRRDAPYIRCVRDIACGGLDSSRADAALSPIPQGHPRAGWRGDGDSAEVSFNPVILAPYLDEAGSWQRLVLLPTSLQYFVQPRTLIGWRVLLPLRFGIRDLAIFKVMATDIHNPCRWTTTPRPWSRRRRGHQDSG